MSVQFGTCNFDGKPVDPKEFDQVRPVLSPYGPDAEGSFCEGNTGILYRAFHTTRESRDETQPYMSASGTIITWDGRVDNRKELIHELGGGFSAGSTDVAIVAAAYDRWGTDCFANLIGDWALSVWDPKDRFLLLAKDFVGTRHLYYSVKANRVTWCTVLDPLVLFAGHSFAVEEEYIAGWLSFFPAADLTPYVGIHSVPPCSFVRLETGRRTTQMYWDFDPAKRISYRTDAEYEEHFRAVFAESVRRRLRSDSPVLAELSGGMDSSSVVCMSDEIIARGLAETPKLDTLSYYDDSEPNWNERPYFTSVEEKRGRTGCHIDVSSQDFFKREPNYGHFAATPASGDRSTEAAKQFAEWIAAHGNRVLLSGIGGDEVAGGVPTAMPELADLLARARFRTLAHQVKVWALNKRKPWFQLLFDASMKFLPPNWGGCSNGAQPAPWLNPDFLRRHNKTLAGYSKRWRLFGRLPSFQENLSTLDFLRRQLGCEALPSEPVHDRSYPYLDRDLLEFLFAIPREQLVRPGQRRSLVRRALVSIVPEAVLQRKRKAFVSRSPYIKVSASASTLTEMSRKMVSDTMGIVDGQRFANAVQNACRGGQAPFVLMMRTLVIEFWLSSVTEQSTTRSTIPSRIARRHVLVHKTSAS